MISIHTTMARRLAWIAGDVGFPALRGDLIPQLRLAMLLRRSAPEKGSGLKRLVFCLYKRAILLGSVLIFRQATLAVTLLIPLAFSTAQAGGVNILSGKGGSGGSVPSAAAAQQAAQQAASDAAKAAQQSINSLTKATQAIQAMRAAQSAARGLAVTAPTTVTNGLSSGGLVVDPRVGTDPSLWINASQPKQTVDGSKINVTIEQQAQKAILTWQQFNVGKNTTVYFDQSKGNTSSGNSWIALNRINDPSGIPSQILGQIKAEGSVYLLNRNGIMFGGSSQVNVNSLVASSLNLFSNDITASNSRFLNGGIGDLSAANGTLAVSKDGLAHSVLLTTNDPNVGDIVVEKGGLLSGGANGLMLLAAPDVVNRGAITVGAGGQIALAAGIGVSYDYNATSFNSNGFYSNGVTTAQFTNDSSTNILRFANYGKITDGAGNDITPVGNLINEQDALIYAPTGNITLLGGNIVQNGGVLTTTSVSRAGSIVITSAYEVGANGAASPSDMLNQTFYTGSVSFGRSAMTAILPDSNGATLNNVASAIAPFAVSNVAAEFTNKLPTSGGGIILVTGQAIDFQGGSLTYAPGQYIAASVNRIVDPRTRVAAVNGSGRVFIEDGAIVDVSGMPDVQMAADADIVTVTLSGNELADSPLQQSGFLQGLKIAVDLGRSGTRDDGLDWVGTPLATLTSYLQLQKKSIGELLVDGGNINLQADEVVTGSGSIINLTGGYLHYAAGVVKTTPLIGADGRLYDIASADPDMRYVGVAGQFKVDHSHWGVTEVYTNPLYNGSVYRSAYVRGGNAGGLTISSGNAVVAGTILANTISGIYQIADGDLATNGSLTVETSGSVEIGDPTVAGAMTAASIAALMPGDGFSMASPLGKPTTGSQATVLDASKLSSSAFASITVSAQNGSLVEDRGATLSVQNGGSISLSGTNATIKGSVVAHAGSITVSTDPQTNLAYGGDIVIDSGATLDVSGLFVNDFGRFDTVSPEAGFIDGGAITLKTRATVVDNVDYTGNIILRDGSRLDASGGGYVDQSGKVKTTSLGLAVGEGGDIGLDAYSDVPAPIPNVIGGVPHGRLEIGDGAVITGLGFNGGGTLTLQTLSAQIGGDKNSLADTGYYVDPKYWGDRGFASLAVRALWDIQIPDGTTIALTHKNLVPNATNPRDTTALTSLVSGTKMSNTFGAATLDTWYRTPTNLSATAGLQLNNYSVTTFPPVTVYGSPEMRLGEGASIIADPGASVSLASYASTVVLGDIKAPGGNISLSVPWGNGTPPAYVGALYLGPNANIDAAGTVVLNPERDRIATSAGWQTPQTGRIYAGGSVSLKGDYVPILAAPGSVIEVSGTAGAYDVMQTAANGLVNYARKTVWSDAGSVAINGNAALLFEGTLIGRGGGGAGEGGTLTLTQDSVYPDYQGYNYLTLVHNLDSALSSAGIKFSFGGLESYVPKIVANSTESVFQNLGGGYATGTMLFGVDTLNGSGFSSLALVAPASQITYTGNVALSLARSVMLSSNAITSTANVVMRGGDLPSPSQYTDGVTAPSLTINAPYIKLSGDGVNATSDSQTPFASRGLNGALTLSASKLLDLSNAVTIYNTARSIFESQGDIRLLPASNAIATDTMLNGSIVSNGDLTFDAARIYPASETAFIVMSGGTVAFGYPNGVAANTAAPLSVDGAIVVAAPSIVQNGNLVAPFGTIALGFSASDLTNIRNNRTSDLDYALGRLLPYSKFALRDYNYQSYETTNLTLGAGGITSVSANGATLLYGATNDLTDWTYGSRVLSTPPTGVVSFGGRSVTVNAGANINLSGGGELLAQEWIAGTGGTRDLLSRYNTSYADGNAAGTKVPIYGDARQIYAIVPGLADVSAYDASLMNDTSIPVGQAVHLDGSNGIPAGTYTLLPAKYATMPGAYRVVVDTNVGAAASGPSLTLPDGTVRVSGYYVDTLTGAQSATALRFLVQSRDVWGAYSDYEVSSANQFFFDRAATNGTNASVLPIDAGRLVLNAVSAISFAPGTVNGAAGTFKAADGTKLTGAGVQLDVAGSYVEVNDTGIADATGYAAISASALRAIGAESILIGGTRTLTDNGLLISPTSYGVIIANDASSPLQAAEVMIVAKPQLSSTATSVALDDSGDTLQVYMPDTSTGSIVVRSSAVIQASGESRSRYGAVMLGVDLSTLPDITGTYTVAQLQAAQQKGVDFASASTGPKKALDAYYTALTQSLGGFVRVSNGNQVAVQTPSYAQLHPSISVVDDTASTSTGAATYTLASVSLAGSITIQNGATLAGGRALAIVSPQGTHIDAGANLSGHNILLAGEGVTVGGTGDAGLVVGANTLAAIRAADTAVLKSFSTLSFADGSLLAANNVDAALTLDAATLVSQGGTANVSGATITLANSFGAAGVSSAGSGSLGIAADQLVFGAGNKTLAGFGSLSLVANKAMIGEGSGSMDFRALPVQLVTPTFVADAGSTQTLTTTGAFSLVAPAGDAPVRASEALGGAITFQGASINVAVPVQAISGAITLNATDGDVTLSGAGKLIARGYAKAFSDTVVYATGGAVTLNATGGQVQIASGALVDVAAAPEAGDAGSLTILSNGSSAGVALDGSIRGSAAKTYAGGSLGISSDSALVLDRIVDVASNGGFSSEVSVRSGAGGLTLSGGRTLKAFSVGLTADGGRVRIDGTIDASGTSGAFNSARKAGGTITLWGKTGVDLTGSLLARGTASNQLGGTVKIGTTATFNSANGYDPTYGYELIDSGSSGSISIGENALIDVSGGTIDGVSGGTVLVRAPLLGDGNANIAFGSGATVRGARGVTLEEYATWSTSDGTTGGQHFDGIIDPAGWYDANGNLLPGVFTAAGTAASPVSTVAVWDGSNLTAAQLTDYLARYFFTPSSNNNDHRTFYGWTNGDDASANSPGTLMGFIGNANLKPIAGASGIGNLVQTTGVELVNPQGSGSNSGNITVATNWNIGATDANGNPVFRHNGAAPILTLRAGGNIVVKASITDGFKTTGNTLTAPLQQDYAGSPSYSSIYTTYGTVADVWNLSSIKTAQGTPLVYDSASMGLRAPATYGQLHLADGQTGDDYYAYYADYLVAYSNYWYNAVSYNDGFFDFVSGSPAPASVTGLLTAAEAIYSATDITKYTPYLAAYALYVTAYNDYSTWVNASTLPVAPQTPPEAALGQSWTPVTIPALAASNLKNAPDLVAAANNIAPIAAMNVAAGISSSYRLVAGADVASANPLATSVAAAADLIIDGHSIVGVQPDSQIANNTTVKIAVPTVVRTGVGSIDVAASGDIEFADPVAPGAIYTAGTIPTDTTSATSIAYSAGAYNTSASGLSTIVTAATHSYGGGNITVNAGGNIVSTQDLLDATGELTNVRDTYTGKSWASWLLTDGDSGWAVNFGGFGQGILSIGGNIAVTAGGNIQDLSVSAATTGDVTTATDGSETLAVTGGGNLTVTAAGNIYSGSYYVGRGSGAISAGGAIASDYTYVPANAAATSYEVATLLAVQDGTISTNARRSVDIGGVFDPTYLWDATVTGNGNSTVSCAAVTSCAPLTPYFTSMTAASGASIISVSGDVRFNTLRPQADLFGNGSYRSGGTLMESLLLPASLGLIAAEGGVSIEHGGGLYPSATGTLTVLAQNDIRLSNPAEIVSSANHSGVVGNIYAWMLGKLAYPTGTGILPTAVAPGRSDVTQVEAKLTHDASLIVGGADPVRFISLAGDLVNGFILPADITTAFAGSNTLRPGTMFGGLILMPNAPARIEAGGDILDLAFYGTNFTASDVTTIVAGGNIGYRTYDTTYSSGGINYSYSATPNIELAGPGSLIVQAGGNIDFPSQRLAGFDQSGIRTLGNSVDPNAILLKFVRRPDPLTNAVPTESSGEVFGNPLLPEGGAPVTVLAGVGKGVDYAGFETAYLNPATAGTTEFFAAFASAVNGSTGGSGQENLSADDAWRLFEMLPAVKQQAIVRSVFFAILNQTGRDYNDASSANYHQYTRGYQAIAALFPASYGYTANGLSGGANGAATLVKTGTIDMRGSTVQTQQGGDIAMLAPGGRILVGSSAASPATDPASEGIITLEKGNVSIFVDQDILVAQSRIFTEQGGDIVIWSSNGDIDAGRGAKTSVSFPPPMFTCNLDFNCKVDVKGAVTGAGIATLQSLLDTPAGDINLMAPRGTVDAGAAGIRVAGNLNIAALQVLNTFNIDVGGTAAGIPTIQAPNITGLTQAQNTAGAAVKDAAPGQPQSTPGEQPSIIIVEVVGYGGGDGTEPTPNDKRRKDNGKQSYNPDAPVRILGHGTLTAGQIQALTPEEQARKKELEARGR